jgi:hypothetical protein
VPFVFCCGLRNSGAALPAASTLRLQFFGHYNEPPVELPYALTAPGSGGGAASGSTSQFLLEFVHHTGQWTVTQVSGPGTKTEAGKLDKLAAKSDEKTAPASTSATNSASAPAAGSGSASAAASSSASKPGVRKPVSDGGSGAKA